MATGLEEGRDGIMFAGQSAPLSYPEHGNELCFAVEDDSFWFQHRNRCLAAVCETFVPERVLVDAGGGNGAVAKFLADRGFRTILVEPGLDGCVNARRRGLMDVICGTLESANFVTGVPAIGCFDVLEHIEDEQKFLGHCRSALKAGGKLILTVPAFPALWSHEDVFAGHYRRYRLGGLQTVVRRAGFDVCYATYFFSILAPAVFLGRALPYRVGRSARTDIRTITRDHASSSAQTIGKALQWEEGWIRKRKFIPFGSSCLLVASAV